MYHGTSEKSSNNFVTFFDKKTPTEQVSVLGLRFLPAAQTVKDKHQRPEDYRRQDQQRAVHKKLLRQRRDDGIGAVIKQPVILAGEKDSVENLKGTVEIQRRQTAHNGKGEQDTAAAHSGGMNAAKTVECERAAAEQQCQHDHTQQGNQ